MSTNTKILIVAFFAGYLCFPALQNGVVTAQIERSAAAKTNGTGAAFGRGFTSQTVTANGVRIHYIRGGSGEPVVLLHGFPQTSFAWRKIAPKLAEKYTVIAPDLRGMGASGKPASGYDKKTIAEDVYQLMRGLGYEKFYLAGHDFGGSTAYALAAAHPEAVRKLAVMECLPAGLLTAEETAAALPTAFKNLAWFQGFHNTPNLPEELIKGREKIYLSWLFDNFTVNKSAITEADINEYARAYSQPGALQAALSFYRTGSVDTKDNQQNAKRKLAMPVLALSGDGSMNEAPMRAMRVAATDVRGEILKDTGHFVPEEQSDYLTEKLLEFFAGQN